MTADHSDYCFSQVRRGDRDRYLTLLFAPAALRDHLAALAAFNLELATVRDQVSESLLGLIRLQWWREAIEEIRVGGPVRQHPVVLALDKTARVRGLDTARMQAMVDARGAELEDQGPPSLVEFQRRADATAGNLLLLSLQVMGAEVADPGLVAAATEVGRAYAAAGIARSVTSDARHRRIRLPGELLARASVNLDRLFDLKPQAELAECLRGVAEEALRSLAQARLARRRSTAKSRQITPLILTGRIAGLQLERLRRGAYDPFAPGMMAAHPMDVWRLLWSSLTGRF